MVHQLGDLLRRRREELELSQREVAERAGVSHTAIARVEACRRRISLELFQRVAEALELQFPSGSATASPDLSRVTWTTTPDRVRNSSAARRMASAAWSEPSKHSSTKTGFRQGTSLAMSRSAVSLNSSMLSVARGSMSATYLPWPLGVSCASLPGHNGNMRRMSPRSE
jgi:transcriptional regulator with XRE-family HTH domain